MRRGRRLGFVGVGIAVPLAVLVAVLLTRDSNPSACNRERVPALRVDLVAAGPDPVPWGHYSRPLEDARLRRNRAQGGLVVEYGSRVPRATLDDLEKWYRSDPVGLIVAPLGEPGETLRLRAWQSAIRCRTFDEPEFAAFRDEHRFRGPERVPRAELQPAAEITIQPQPVRGAATISLVLPPPGQVELEVRSPSGETIRRLGGFSGVPGQRLSVSWDGRDEDGRRLARGSYEVVVRREGRAAISTPFRVR